MNAPSKKLYWIAIRGSAVPHWPIPVTADQMRDSAVHVGELPGEATVWSIGDSGRLPGLTGNYDVLIGYNTAAAQQGAVRKLLHAPIKEARAEYRRALVQEAVIWPGGPDATGY
jgi:hypothetical protein